MARYGGVPRYNEPDKGAAAAAMQDLFFPFGITFLLLLRKGVLTIKLITDVENEALQDLRSSEHTILNL